MLNFTSDYLCGAHPEVLQKLLKTNLEQLSGYGTDNYTLLASEKIKKACESFESEVFFLMGGTQTNQVIIDTLLQSYEGVIAADTGHISVHEAGAIEFSGHKVLPLAQKNGKITAKQVREFIQNFYKEDSYEHMVFPGMVYLSFPTEYGTLYSKKEIQDLSRVCKDYNIPLFVDGARLGYGLASYENDLKLSDLASLCDVFYIGGTKVGALCGEAVVFQKGSTPKHFVTRVKQHGALLANGRLLGIQFDALFTEDLYFKISRHAIEMAEALKEVLKEKGYPFFVKSPTNQQFVLLENVEFERLKDKVKVGVWERPDEAHTVVRFATSCATEKKEIEELRNLLLG